MQTKEEYIYKVLLRTLETAETIIKKAILHVEEGKCTEEEILNAKLADDMFPFVKQIQILSDNVKGGLARLSDNQVPKYDDTETTLAELLKRIYTTREFVLTINPSDIKDLDNKTITLPWMPEGMSWSASSYAEKFVLQNTFFHLTTAYNIIRMKGVAIGKMDFLGQI
jgi:uncharacterized protein